ncbi:MAG: DHHA1 domain-containing protein [Cetobacterium sp.]
MIKNITHTDLDGLLSSLALQFHYGADKVKTRHCGYNNVDKEVLKMLEEGDTEVLYITDISISKEVADIIDKGYKDKVVLLDHHMNEDTQKLLGYSWVDIRDKDEDGLKTSGCWMTYKYLVKLGMVESALLEDLCNLGRYYDTWMWSSPKPLMEANKLNTLLYEYGFDMFLEECHRQLQGSPNKSFDFGGSNDIILKLQEAKVSAYVKKANKRLFPVKIDEISIGVYFGSSYISNVCHALHTLNPKYDAIMCINMESNISIRTNNPNIDVNILAKRIGANHGFKAGGHKSASGITVDTSFKLDFIDKITGM